MIYLDPWTALALVLLAVYGAEHLMISVVRLIARRKPKPPSPIIKP